MAENRKTYYLGVGRCLHAIPVSPRQKILVAGAERRLRGVRDIELVELCSGQWGMVTIGLVRTIRRLEARDGVTIRQANCRDERDRLAAL